MSKVIIETDRLILRQFRSGDEEAILAFNGDQEVQRYTGDVLIQTLEEARALIQDVWLADYDTYGYGRWAVIHKADAKLIGFAGLKFLPELEETDIGFRFLPAYWGKGLATEAAAPIMQHGFDHFGLKKIIGIAMPENKGSCRVLEKLGMQLFKKESYFGEGKMFYWYVLEKECG